jgi:hypothetical protein
MSRIVIATRRVDSWLLVRYGIPEDSEILVYCYSNYHNPFECYVILVEQVFENDISH